MKKKLILTISISAIALVLGFGLYHTNASQQDPKLSFDDIKELVKQQYPGELTEIELEKDYNRVVYEVELEGNGKKYSIKLDGNTGEVLKMKEKQISQKTPVQQVEIEEHEDTQDTQIAQNNDSTNTKSNQSNKEVKKEKSEENSNHHENKSDDKEKHKSNHKEKHKSKEKKKVDKKAVISVAEATEIALKEFPGYVTEVELDEDDGRLIYEIEIKSGDKEAEFEIDAITGKILVIDIDD
ncbi:PepSY domain-containing protein [Virgibacillus soli]|uniref:PepSY domain-containing protein n=1 Tax=Paracerasibacillus soli TaxID=480284 RepID=A0ABU5CX33_9BACI|nr:PepSY domain-containing protein [Virgibacillus soli]MDY0410441.1 PepSY domain-containing protein [Virgibacillus soli]